MFAVVSLLSRLFEQHGKLQLRMPHGIHARQHWTNLCWSVGLGEWGGVRVQRNSVLSGSDLEVPQMNGLSQLSRSPSVFLCVCVCPSVRLSECVRLYVRLSVCMSVYVRLSVRLSVCVCPSVCLRVSACLPVCVHQSVCACVRLSVYL